MLSSEVGVKGLLPGVGVAGDPRDEYGGVAMSVMMGVKERSTPGV